MQNAVNDIYPFRVPEFVDIYDLTWDDVAQCARDGYTIKDTAAVLGVSHGNLQKALKRRPDVHALFLPPKKQAWVAKRGYNGSKVIGTIVCSLCGQTKDRTGVNQIVCEDCRPKYQAQQSAIRHQRAKEKKPKKEPKKRRVMHPWKQSSWRKVAQEMSA